MARVWIAAHESRSSCSDVALGLSNQIEDCKLTPLTEL